MKIAFVGFRHMHGKAAYERIVAEGKHTVCGICEEDPETRAALLSDGIPVTHDDYAAMLAQTSPDAVVVCDRFDLRGGRVIDALRAGCHVIADKPLCTSLEELAAIERLAREKSLHVGLWLTLRELPYAARLRERIAAGENDAAISIELPVGKNFFHDFIHIHHLTDEMKHSGRTVIRTGTAECTGVRGKGETVV